MGFMPPDEGLALLRGRAARRATPCPAPRFVEIGSWCGKSSVYLGAAARRAGDRALRRRPPPRLGGEPAGLGAPRPDARRPERTGSLDTLPGVPPHDLAAPASRTRDGRGRRLARRSPRSGRRPCALVFIDGGHGEEPAHADYDAWAPTVAPRRPASPSTTCSPTPPTAAARRTRSTCGPSRTASSEVIATGSLRVLQAAVACGRVVNVPGDQLPDDMRGRRGPRDAAPRPVDAASCSASVR